MMTEGRVLPALRMSAHLVPPWALVLYILILQQALDKGSEDTKFTGTSRLWVSQSVVLIEKQKAEIFSSLIKSVFLFFC
jgi:hypothetical protein